MKHWIFTDNQSRYEWFGWLQCNFVISTPHMGVLYIYTCYSHWSGVHMTPSSVLCVKAVPSIGSVGLIQRTWLNSALAVHAYRWLCYCCASSQARPTCPVCNTESNPRCGWLGLSLLDCWEPSGDYRHAVAFKCVLPHDQSAMRACVVHAYYGIGIDNRPIV